MAAALVCCAAAATGYSTLGVRFVPGSPHRRPLRDPPHIRSCCGRPSPCIQTFPHRAAPVKMCDRSDEPQQRMPYFVSGLPRPKYRGVAVGWLHSTRAWYLIALAYAGAAWWLSASPMALRFLAACVTSANIWISDGYHNADRRSAAARTPRAELTWLRADYTGISCILTYNLWLWASNLGLPWRSPITALSGIATALVGLFSCLATADANHFGHLSVKLIMAFQYFCLFPCLVLGSPTSLARGLALAVYFTYGRASAGFDRDPSNPPLPSSPMPSPPPRRLAHSAPKTRYLHPLSSSRSGACAMGAQDAKEPPLRLS
jgi:hypothetical protein